MSPHRNPSPTRAPAPFRLLLGAAIDAAGIALLLMLAYAQWTGTALRADLILAGVAGLAALVAMAAALAIFVRRLTPSSSRPPIA
ncbi:hypothetical protein [Sphingobium olei]|uniref:Uncharacterized protein n=1 Tax=Sphingobium olei TaxID=420955 RepID=A0ABW3P961_9SPHN